MAKNQSLTARLGLDATGFKLGVKEAESIANKFAKDFRRSMVDSIGGMFAGGFVWDKLKESLNSFLEKSKGIKEASDTWDSPIERMSMWTEIAVKARVEFGALISMFSKLEQAKKDAFESSTSSSGKAFESLGIKQSDLIGKNGEQMAEMIIRAFQSRGNPSGDAAAVRELFGRGVGSNTELLGVEWEKMKRRALSEADVNQGANVQSKKEDAINDAKSAIGKSIGWSLGMFMRFAEKVGERAGDGSTGNVYDVLARDKAAAEYDKRKGVKAEEEKRKNWDEINRIRREADEKILSDARAEEQRKRNEKMWSLEKSKLEKDASIFGSVFGKAYDGGSSFDKQGLFLRGVPTSANPMNDAVKVLKSILPVVQDINNKTGRSMF